MADYILINEYSNKGDLAISRKVIASIVDEAVARILNSSNPGIKKAKVSSPTEISFKKNGKVGIDVSISLKKSAHFEEICLKVQEEIAHDLATYTESLPFEITISIAEIK